MTASFKTTKAQRNWAELTAPANDTLTEYQSALATFRSVLEQFFIEAAEGKTFQRRPTFGFRLPAEGLPGAILTAVPDWDRRERQLLAGEIWLELIATRCHVISGVPHPRRNVRIVLHPDRSPRLTSISREHGTEATRRLCQTVQAFLDDPHKTFGTSSDHCCICRALWLIQRLARGIGPECFGNSQKLAAIVFKMMAVSQSSEVSI